MSREIKFSYIWQHAETGRFLEQFHTIDGIENGDVTAHIADHQRKRYTLVARREFTGFKDKNGVDLYEGDVYMVSDVHAYDMSDPNPCLRVIRWDEAEGRLNQFRVDGKLAKTGYTFCKANAEKLFERIGNEFENPELLSQD